MLSGTIKQIIASLVTKTRNIAFYSQQDQNQTAADTTDLFEFIESRLFVRLAFLG